tara:strand:+ start:34127 stop:34447 length:321 start_codon:yes stop_codon:yes gene_type:complete
MNDRITWIDLYLSLSNAKDRESISKVLRRNPLRIVELVRQTVTIGSFSDEAETITVSELNDLRIFAATLIAWIDIEFEQKKRRERREKQEQEKQEKREKRKKREKR